MNLVGHLVDLLRPYQFRGKARLLSRLVANSGVRSVRVHGVGMELDLSEYIQRMIYLGAYERWETRVVRRHLQPGMCFVDVGANVGYFSLLAARAVGPTGRVIAVEPSGYAADRLSKTIADNRLSNIRLDRIGLGRESGTVTLYDPLPDNHTPTMIGADDAPGISVPVRRLDDCLPEWGVQSVDLLKMDVEGYESAVIDGGITSLAAGRVRAILCEFNAHWLRRSGTSSGELRDRILGFGFLDKTGSPWVENEGLSNRLFVLPDSLWSGGK